MWQLRGVLRDGRGAWSGQDLGPVGARSGPGDPRKRKRSAELQTDGKTRRHAAGWGWRAERPGVSLAHHWSLGFLPLPHPSQYESQPALWGRG